MDTCNNKLKACLALLAVLMYQLLSFFAFVAFAIGLSVVASNFYEYLMGGALPSACETFICMYLISIFAEFHIFCQKECVGTAFASYYRLYPTLLTSVTMLVYSTIYMIAFAQLYFQFEEAHISLVRPDGRKHFPNPNRNRSSDILVVGRGGGNGEILIGTGGSTEAEQWHTVLFLLSLSYIVYCTMKLIHLDTIHQVRRITNQASCIHWIVRLGFLGVHIVMNILYSIPLIIVAFSVSIYESTGALTFVQLNVVGVLCGIVFAVMETRRPWPIARSMGPFYLYENNARAKSILGQLQIILILFFYYRPFSIGKINAPLTAQNPLVITFCFSVAFTMLHYVKTLTFIIIQKEENNYQLENDIVDDDDIMGDIVVVEVDNPGGSDQPDPIPVEPRAEINVDDMCKRCKRKSVVHENERKLDDVNMNKVVIQQDSRDTKDDCSGAMIENKDKEQDKVNVLIEEDNPTNMPTSEAGVNSDPENNGNKAVSPKSCTNCNCGNNSGNIGIVLPKEDDSQEESIPNMPRNHPDNQV